MYLSRIAIDLDNRNTWRALDNPEILHGMVESCFSGDRLRTLWRLDELNGYTYLLLLSPQKPDFASLAAQIGLPGAGWEIRDYQGLLNRMQPGTVWQFRLCANPVTSLVCPGEKRGKVKALTLPHDQRNWIRSQAEKHGFLLYDGQFDVVRSEWRNFRNKGKTITFLSTVFEGILTVTNADAFQEALKNGIGRGKAYGMGMLTVTAHG